ncbi:phage major capsid protein [Acidipropionibacterium jensenii]|uniref:phage major capsid protein n=1 Tax=Acidipropionibacterium jensenii TaxID=1749 RepID=UPI00110A2724|nr:phage major capsid protein [Acidipropionibacterium jensenii]QCV88204.1 phage major capsid protein [Acidipropionibacterium jensenii]
MAMHTTSGNRSWLPEQAGQLVVQPVTQASVAIQAAGSVVTDSQVNGYRVPVWKADPTAAFVAEGEEIPVTDGQLAEAADTFHKLAGLTIISREMAADSNPDVAEQIGLGLARDIARKLDAAIFGGRGADTLAPEGLADLTGTTTIDAGTAWTNTDPFSDALYSAEQVGAQLSAFVANPADARLLAKLKTQTGSQLPLLGSDPTMPTRRQIVGVPMLTSPAVTAGTVWGIPAGRIVIAIRSDVELLRDESVFFTSDRVAIKATMRVTSLFPHEAAIQKISLSS